MTGPEIMATLMFVVVCGVLILGYPVALALGGTALGMAFLGWAMGMFDLNLLGSLSSRYFGTMINEVLVAVPLFVFMGVMLERAKLAEQLLETMGLLFGRLRGGLAYSVIFVGMLLAASTGIVGATVVTMGLLSLPTMLRAGYDPKLATGVIAASGTLGQVIPPSIILVLLGDILQGAYAEAQRAVGNWAPEPISVVDLFAGAFLPGMLLVGLYALWVLVKSIIDPKSCPALVEEGEKIENLGRRVVEVLLPPAALILAVLGSILAGVATPTEAAAVGAIGTILLAGRSLPRLGLRLLDPGGGLPSVAGVLAIVALFVLTRFFDLRVQRNDIPFKDMIAIALALATTAVLAWGLLVCILREIRSEVLPEVMRSTTKITSMVFLIFLGASVFSLVFRGFGGDEMVAHMFDNMPGGAYGAMALVMLVMFVLGFFLDFIEIIFVVVPIVGPVLLRMEGIDPIWFGVMVAVNLQTSFLTPPFGFALFYLQGVAPRTIATAQIYKGIVPFVILQIVGLGLLWTYPELATWLPKALFG
jgi:tripartite ATP-independent transporter DctM subunit